MKKYFIPLLLSLSFVFNFATHASYERDFENEIWYDYSNKNTLPNLSLLSSEKNDKVSKDIGKLTKITRTELDYLESLSEQLKSSIQYRPDLSPERSVYLLEGNEKPTSHRGWIIKINEENKEIPVGFVCYSHQRNVYFNPLNKSKNSSLSCLEGKTCFEIEWYIEPSFQGKGIAHLAVQAVLNYAQDKEKEKVKIDWLLAVIASNNKRSQIFAKKNSFKLLGIDENINQEIWAYPLMNSSLKME
jgi:RimJ/RimL family protein N-acetyltransferase